MESCRVRFGRCCLQQDALSRGLTRLAHNNALILRRWTSSVPCQSEAAPRSSISRSVSQPESAAAPGPSMRSFYGGSFVRRTGTYRTSWHRVDHLRADLPSPPPPRTHTHTYARALLQCRWRRRSLNSYLSGAVTVEARVAAPAPTAAGEGAWAGVRSSAGEGRELKGRSEV